MVYGAYNYSIHGVYKPTYNTGGPHIVDVNGNHPVPTAVESTSTDSFSILGWLSHNYPLVIKPSNRAPHFE